MHKRIAIALLVFGSLTAAGITPAQEQGTRFEITFPASAHAGPITGRVFVMLARNNDAEPRFQIGRTGSPFFGRDIDKLAPGEKAIIDGGDLGSPIENVNDLPAGDYFVQAMFNVYSEFKRADGHVLWMHDDQWEGQRWEISPGNLKSEVRSVHIDSKAGSTQTIKLVASVVIPPIEVPPDTEWVQRFKIQSPSLTKFWGRPIYIGATVLLPKDYARETIHYPVVYEQGHFDLAAPLGFRTDAPTEEELAKAGPRASFLKRGYELYQAWITDNFPRMLVVTFQHPNPYFDDSYDVNSVNVGPYGDSVMRELIPEVEKRFRSINEPYARILDGRFDRRVGSSRLTDFPSGFFWRHVGILSGSSDVHERRRHQHLQGHECFLQAIRMAARADRQFCIHRRAHQSHFGTAESSRTRRWHARTLRRADRYLVGCFRPNRK